MIRFAVLLACVVIANVSAVGLVALSAAVLGSVVSVSGIARDVRELRREQARIEARFGR